MSEARGVKVVIINTQYVETDATSFKSVVQNLTGKDSKVAHEPSSSKQHGRRNQAGAGFGNGVSGTSDGRSFLAGSRIVFAAVSGVYMKHNVAIDSDCDDGMSSPVNLHYRRLCMLLKFGFLTH
ncbi:hypothetical protein RJ639_020533 [Escallonia herrerae]|uniref:VQ domain-containing protein n=1 Tax=Escallonia herrerae TaxID=1293975 RepID=A0AA88V486_9ASTE|nr:hypothetical protein RJ639_020533 [Escallonia herrerae]